MLTPSNADAQAREIAKALRAAVVAIGGPKHVGGLLWPNKDLDDAEGLVNDCINPNRREKFALIEVVAILVAAREAGCHDAIHALTKACGYQPPRVVDQRGRNADSEVAAIVPQLLGEMLDELRDIRTDSRQLSETMQRFAEKYA